MGLGGLGFALRIRSKAKAAQPDAARLRPVSALESATPDRHDAILTVGNRHEGIPRLTPDAPITQRDAECCDDYAGQSPADTFELKA